MLDGNATVEWTPPQYKETDGRLAPQHGRLEHPRAAATSACRSRSTMRVRHLNVIGSRAEREERAVSGLEQLEELHRRGSDAVRIRCEACDAEIERVEEVGTPGSTPASSTSRRSVAEPEWIPHGSQRRVRRDLRRRPADNAVLESGSGRLGLGGTLSDPPLVLLTVLHGRHARRPPAVRPRPHVQNVVDETGPRCTSRGGTPSISTTRSSGWAPTRCGGSTAPRTPRRSCASVRPSRGSSSAASSLSGTRSSSSSTTPTPSVPALPGRPRARREISRRSTAGRRAHARVRARGRGSGTTRYDTVGLTREWESSPTTSRTGTSAARAALLGRDDEAAFATLWYALVQPLRVLAPILPVRHRPPLAHPRSTGRSRCTSRAGGGGRAGPALLDEIASVRRVVELGRRQRSTSGIKLRQPLRRLVVEGAALDGPCRGDRGRAAVKEVELGSGRAGRLR